MQQDETPQSIIPLTRSDVIECYRTVLGRDPENEEVIQQHILSQPSAWSLVRSFLQSNEYIKRVEDEAASRMRDALLQTDIECSASAEEIQKILFHFKRKWSGFGSVEPYFSVLTDDRYRSSNIDQQRIEEFYGSGIIHLDLFENACKRNQITLDPSWEVLDFGCGVGRLAEHFAARYRTYIGVDVSEAHLRIAKARAAGLGIASASFSTIEDFLRDPPQCDVFYSILVLQHNPPPLMAWLLNRLLARVRPGGIAYFQIPCHLYNYTFNRADYLNRLDESNDFELHALPQQAVLRILADCGFAPLEVVPYQVIGPVGFSFTFLAKRL